MPGFAGVLGRRLRLGLVGGGPGSLIGETHRIAARLGGRYELVAAAVSRDPARSRSAAADLFLAPDRAYPDWRAMAEAEAARGDGIDVVAVATPPDSHAEICAAFLERGVDVICDKPMTVTLDEALALERIVARTGRVFGLTHNYSGYPMVRHARAMVRGGALGRVRLVVAEFAHGAPAMVVEEPDPARRHWRYDPSVIGRASVLGEIGVHAYHLARFVSGLEVGALSARLGTFAAGRSVFDNAFLSLRFEGGAEGTLWASYVAAGNEHGLGLRVFGETGGLTWRQEDPNVLVHAPLGEAPRRLTRGRPDLSPEAARATRIPAGHPEGFLEAFAVLYDEIAEAVAARRAGTRPDPAAPAFPTTPSFPTVADGVAGQRMIEAALRSHDSGGAWIEPGRLDRGAAR